MIGGYIAKSGMRFTFKLAECETCGKGGKIKGTQEKQSKRPATFMLSHQPQWLFEKIDMAGLGYDRLCGPCIERLELLEAKRAGEHEVANQ
tara:strand:+ start:1257 stop:1529 length:273 start_codon:yes stop_codon:yes gene_type:complete